MKERERDRQTNRSDTSDIVTLVVRQSEHCLDVFYSEKNYLFAVCEYEKPETRFHAFIEWTLGEHHCVPTFLPT